MSSWDPEHVATLACIVLRERTKARKQTCLVDQQHFNCLPQARLRQVTFQSDISTIVIEFKNTFRETLTWQLLGGWILVSTPGWKIMLDKIRTGPLSGLNQQLMKKSL